MAMSGHGRDALALLERRSTIAVCGMAILAMSGKKIGAQWCVLSPKGAA